MWPSVGSARRWLQLRRTVLVVGWLVVALALACVLPRSWSGTAAAPPVFVAPTFLAGLAAVAVVVVAALSCVVLGCVAWVCWPLVCAAAASVPKVAVALDVMEVTGLPLRWLGGWLELLRLSSALTALVVVWWLVWLWEVLQTALVVWWLVLLWA